MNHPKPKLSYVETNFRGIKPSGQTNTTFVCIIIYNPDTGYYVPQAKNRIDHQRFCLSSAANRDLHPYPVRYKYPKPTASMHLSAKTVNQAVIKVGDVITYTLSIIKVGGPAQIAASEFLLPELGNISHLTHTVHPTDFFDYSLAGHALAWVGPMTTGLDIVTITYRLRC